MGAGSQTDHYIQDATEQDLVYRVQELLVRDNFAVTDNVEIKKKEFDDRLIDKKIVSLYASSDYKKCLDKNLIKVYNALISHRSGIKFDIVWIMRYQCKVYFIL